MRVFEAVTAVEGGFDLITEPYEMSADRIRALHRLAAAFDRDLQNVINLENKENHEFSYVCIFINCNLAIKVQGQFYVGTGIAEIWRIYLLLPDSKAKEMSNDLKCPYLVSGDFYAKFPLFVI